MYFFKMNSAMGQTAKRRVLKRMNFVLEGDQEIEQAGITQNASSVAAVLTVSMIWKGSQIFRKENRTEYAGSYRTEQV